MRGRPEGSGVPGIYEGLTNLDFVAKFHLRESILGIMGLEQNRQERLGLDSRRVFATTIGRRIGNNRIDFAVQQVPRVYIPFPHVVEAQQIKDDAKGHKGIKFENLGKYSEKGVIDLGFPLLVVAGPLRPFAHRLQTPAFVCKGHRSNNIERQCTKVRLHMNFPSLRHAPVGNQFVHLGGHRLVKSPFESAGVKSGLDQAAVAHPLFALECE